MKEYHVRLARWIKWWACDEGESFRHFTYITTHSPTLPTLYVRHSSLSNPSVASPTSQLILQPFFRYPYVTSSSLNSPGEPHMIFFHNTFCANMTRWLVFTIAFTQKRSRRSGETCLHQPIVKMAPARCSGRLIIIVKSRIYSWL